MYPYIGSTPISWRYSEEGYEPMLRGWVEMSACAMFGGLFTGFLQRGFVLYTSQIERLRTLPSPERLTSRSMTSKGMAHTLVKAYKAEGLVSLIHGSSTLCLLAPLNVLGTSIMTYYFFDIGMSQTLAEDVKKAAIGLSAVVACEFLATPLRALYLLQASTPIGSPCFKTRDFKWFALKQHRPGMNAFVISSAVFSLSYLFGALWHRKVSHSDPPASYIQDKDGRYHRSAGDSEDMIRFAVTSTPFLIGSTFAWLVGLRQFLNYHHHDPQGLMKDAPKPSIQATTLSPSSASTSSISPSSNLIHNPRLRYTSCLQPWLYQLRVGPRAIFLGLVSSLLIWPPGPYISAWVAWSRLELGLFPPVDWKKRVNG